MEVTRKRVRANLMTEKTEVCPVCKGSGHIYSLETSLSIIDRSLSRARTKGRLKEVTLVVSTPMINVFCNDFGRMFNYLEYKHHMKINLVEDERSYVNQFSIYDSKGEEITDLFESV